MVSCGPMGGGECRFREAGGGCSGCWLWKRDVQLLVEVSVSLSGRGATRDKIKEIIKHIILAKYQMLALLSWRSLAMHGIFP